jgi:Tol biopolymer transport system component
VRTSFPRAAALVVVIAALPLAGCDEKVTSDVDVTPPETAITSPLSTSSVSGAGFFITISATDDVGVERVEVSVDGADPVVLTAAPYRVHVVTLDYAEGASLAIQATAFDAAQNSDIAAVSVSVAARTLTNLTADPQIDSDPAWSPDGTQIAFQSNRSVGELNIWVMDDDGTNPVQLTSNVNEDRHPAWSPDGDWIAFDSDREGTFDIWRMPLVMGEAAAENLTFGNDDDIEPVYSPAGTAIWFASSRGDETDFDIWWQPVGTGAAIQATAFAVNERAPALSADGTVLAFTSELDLATPHVYTMLVGQTGVSPLTGDGGVTESDPAWAPAGNVVTFTRAASTHGDLWFKPVDPNVPVTQGTFGTGTVGDGGAAWHPNGDRLAFHSDRDGNLDIWVVE